MKDEALRQALDYIIATNKSSTFWLVPQSELNKTVTAIKQALAQPEPDPVATVYEGAIAKWNLPDKFTGFLYTSPPKREPLTDDELIQKILDAGFERNSLGWTFTYGRLDYHLLKFARAIEAAHGIKGEA